MDTSSENYPKAASNMGCGILSRYPIISIVSFAAGGVGLGIVLSEWNPADDDIKNALLSWVGLVGDLFIRALEAVVLPLLFVNVTCAVVDMIMMGRATTVGSQTIVLFTTTTVLAAMIGLISILTFQDLIQEREFEEGTKALIQLGCTTEGELLAENTTDGRITCVEEGVYTSLNTQFEIIDVTAGLQTTTSGLAELSLSETLYQGVFLKLVTENILHSLVDGNFASVVVFATVFGMSMGKTLHQQGHSSTAAKFVMPLFQEMSEVLLKIINWIMAATPFAVCSLIANAVGSQQDLSSSFSNVGYLIAANVCGYAAHFCITYVGFFFLASGLNPFEYLRSIIPAQATALACASSAATLPVTLRCVKSSGKVPDDIRNFVCPLGATINMDGSAIHFPCACLWLAALNGINPDVGSYILLIILAIVGSAATAPVPSSGLVLVMTAYNTIFGTGGVPNGFEFVIAIDWFLDRMITALNVTGDTVVAAIISSRADAAPKFNEIVSGIYR